MYTFHHTFAHNSEKEAAQ